MRTLWWTLWIDSVVNFNFYSCSLPDRNMGWLGSVSILKMLKGSLFLLLLKKCYSFIAAIFYSPCIAIILAYMLSYFAIFFFLIYPFYFFYITTSETFLSFLFFYTFLFSENSLLICMFFDSILSIRFLISSRWFRLERIVSAYMMLTFLPFFFLC